MCLPEQKNEQLRGLNFEKADDKLTSTDNSPQKSNARWKLMFDLVKKYVEECLLFPSASQEYEGEKIGQWYRNQLRLVKNGTIEISRKEALVELSSSVKNEGIDKLSEYVGKTGLLPKGGTKCGKQLLGKWLRNIISEYYEGALEPEFVDRLNKITYEWCAEQTYIIGKRWVDNVPFGDLPITIVYSDKECIPYMEQGIYGCYQLYAHFTELSKNCFGKNVEKKSEYDTKKREILSTLCTEQVGGSYELLEAVLGKSPKEAISNCFNLAEKAGVNFENVEVFSVQKSVNDNFSFLSQSLDYADEDQMCDDESYFLDSFIVEDEGQPCGFDEADIDLKNFKHLGKYGVEALSLRIEELNLSDRTYNCLARAGICTVEDITCRTEEDMIKIRALGKRSLDEITYLLHSLGLDFKYDEE